MAVRQQGIQYSKAIILYTGILKGADRFVDKALYCTQANYQATEEMIGSEQLACETCRKKTDGTKRIRLKRLPTFMTVNLKRMVYNIKVSNNC